MNTRGVCVCKREREREREREKDVLHQSSLTSPFFLILAAI